MGSIDILSIYRCNMKKIRKYIRNIFRDNFLEIDFQDKIIDFYIEFVSFLGWEFEGNSD